MLPISSLINDGDVKSSGSRSGRDSSQEMQEISQNLSKSMGDDWELTLLAGVKDITAVPCSKLLSRIGLDEVREQPFTLLDQACGPGVTVGEIQRMISDEVLRKSIMLSSDVSAQMVEACRRRIAREGWAGKCEARVLNAEDSGLQPNTFSHITVNLGFHVIPNAEGALLDCIRVLEPGGILGLTTIHEFCAGFTPDLRSAFHSVGAPYPFPFPQQTHTQGKWYDQNWVRENLVKHGLEQVNVDISSHLSPVANAAGFVAGFSQVIEYIRNSFWSGETRTRYDREKLKQSIIEHLEKKYKGKGWDLAWTMIIATGRKRSDIGGSYTYEVPHRDSVA